MLIDREEWHVFAPSFLWLMIGQRTGKLAVLTAAPSYKCPAAPYEAAMLLESHCRKQKIREQVQIDFYAAEPGPMGVAGKEISAAASRASRRAGRRTGRG